MRKTRKHLCIFDCIISKKIVCLCMLLSYIMTGARTAIFIHPYLSLRWWFRILYIQFKYINFIFIHSVQYAV